MNKPLVTGVFVSLLSLMCAAGYVSSNPGLEAERLTAQRADLFLRDAHVAHYEEHLVKLGIDRLNCR